MILRVDPTMCVGYGSCAQLVPELVTLDEWGFPILGGADDAPAVTGFERDRRSVEVPSQLEHLSRRAVHICPKLALSLNH